MANPALNSKTFTRFGTVAATEAMTVEGTVNKTGILLFLCLATACYEWAQTYHAIDPSAAMPGLIGGLLGGLVFAIATIVKKQWAPVTAPLYALCEGLVLGGVSAFYATELPGIVQQAVGLTFGTLAVMLLAYRAGWIRATPLFQRMVIAATGAIALVYAVTLVLALFHVSVPFIHQGGTFGIIFSLVVVAVAAMNLVLDFNLIEQGVQASAPKFLEWYAAFSLLITLVWLYLEILRLLGKLRRR